ncbi:hypothetical protein R1flu_002421 [Riccia fluitans]|uniref:Uncharacterized protein n=1 Tax=Riccia fluitans TaxID=41844 RepID=A0ABD1Y6F8_9MARC
MRSFRSSNTLVYLDAKGSFEEIEQGKNSHSLSQLTDTFRVASIVKNKHSGNEKVRNQESEGLEEQLVELKEDAKLGLERKRV